MIKLKTHVVAVTAALAAMSTAVDAASIGRGGGFSSRPSFSRSVSAPKPSTPSAPNSASTVTKPGGIGGTAGSIGVRKSEPTNQAAANLANRQSSVTPVTPATTPTTAPQVAPAPSYGYSAPPAPQVTNGSTFMSSLGGSFVGSALGNMLFSNHGSGSGTTVINNTGSGGTGLSGPATSAAPAAGTVGAVDANGFSAMPAVAAATPSYGIGSFIKDVFLFAILVGLLVGIAFVFYKGYKMIRDYVRKERGVATTLPFDPLQQFWKIQRSFAAADVSELRLLLGVGIFDELTQNLTPSAVSVYNVSYELALTNAREISVHYTFFDNDEEINQVWHYELHNSQWKLEGIENI